MEFASGLNNPSSSAPAFMVRWCVLTPSEPMNPQTPIDPMTHNLDYWRSAPHWSYSSINALLNICSLQWAFRKVY